MFNRYWREYPWYFQLFQYIVFIFVFASLFGGVVAPLLVPKLSGVSGAVELTTASSRAEINAVLWTQAIGHFGLFTLPALVFAYLTHPRAPQYLGLRRPGRSAQPWIVVLLTIGAIPVVLALGGVMRLFDFGEAANKLHAQTEAMMKTMMNIHTGGQLAWTLFVMALLPAVGEELMFRGVLMRFMARRSRTMLFPVVLSAVMFALFHISNPYGLLPIFGMGVLLALVYYWTRSLWCSMAMHFLFNASQILLYFTANRNAAVKTFIESDSLPVGWLIGGAAIFTAGLWLSWRSRTPLPQPGWASDFSPEEIAAREEQQRQH